MNDRLKTIMLRRLGGIKRKGSSRDDGMMGSNWLLNNKLLLKRGQGGKDFSAQSSLY